MIKKFKNKFTIIIIMSTILSIFFSCDNSEIVQKTSEKIFDQEELVEVDIDATVEFLVKATVETLENVENKLINSAVATIISLPESTPLPTATPIPTATPQPIIVKEIILTPTPLPTPIPTIIPTETSTPVPAPISQSNELSLAELVTKASKSVVKISSANGVGSGVIYNLINENAYILTNQHVVGYSSQVDVVITDVETFSGEVVTIDVQKDIAIVKICCSGEFSSINFADPDEIKLGETVAALGYPLGASSIRVSKGIVSGVEYESDSNRNVIQTDAAINPGNSGGPLLLMSGKLAGINTYKVINSESGVPTEGIGFAISISTLLQITSSNSNSQNEPSSPEPHPETENGIYTSIAYGYKVNAPLDWILDTSNPSSVSLLHQATSCWMRIEHNDDTPGFFDITDWSTRWEYSGESWQLFMEYVGQSEIYRSYAGDDENFEQSTMLKGLEVTHQFYTDGVLWNDITHLFYKNDRLWRITMYCPNSIWNLSTTIPYRKAITDTLISYKPPKN
ncbi:MAG: S1C family serine protease [Dehalococcoidia bacterium]